MSPQPAPRPHGQSLPHEVFPELVAGLALDALEPQEEALVLAHLPTCYRCQQSLVELTDVAAELARSAGQGDLQPWALPALPPQELDAVVHPVSWRAQAPQPRPVDDRLTAARDPEASGVRREVGGTVGAGGAPDVPAGTGMPPAARTPAPGRTPVTASVPAPRSERGRLVAVGAGAVAAVALIALAVLAPWQSRGTDARVELAMTQALSTGATATRLTGDGSAVLVVADNHAWLSVTGLPRTDPARDSYVVWAVHNNVATATSRFDVPSGGGTKALDLGTNAQFAGSPLVLVTRETGTGLPGSPHGPRVLVPAN